MDVCILTATTKGDQREFRLADGEVATFGRSSSCAFQVPDIKVSRQHCLLGFRNGILEVTDLGSANDIKHRGERKSNFTVVEGDGFHAGKTYVAFTAIEVGDTRPPTSSATRVVAKAQRHSSGELEAGEDASPSVQDPTAEEVDELAACAPRQLFPHAGEPAIGGMMGAYRMLSVLGRSDRGTAFVAEHIQLHRRVAIKWLRRDEFGESTAAVFLADMRKAASLPGALSLSVFDVEPDGDHRYAAMELADGRSLASFIQDGPRLTHAEATQAIADVLRALDALHARQAVHGGVKPENVFVMTRGGGKLSDLRAEPRLRPMEWAACAAPELGKRGEATRLSDLYSVGAVFFAAITGGLSPCDARGRPADIRATLTRDASLPSSLVDWVCAMTDENPAIRPQSAAIALELLLATQVAPAVVRSQVKRADADPPVLARSAAPMARPAAVRGPAVPRRPAASPVKVFFARLTGELIVFTIILVAGIALLLLLKIKFPDFDIYRLIERVKPQ